MSRKFTETERRIILRSLCFKEKQLSFKKKKEKGKFLKQIKRYKFYYLLLLPTLLLTFYFQYLTMPGVLISFMDYDVFGGFLHSPWVGFKHFKDIFTLPLFTKAIGNTVLLSVLGIIIHQPAPLIFALLLNEVKCKFFKRTVQTVSYLPHFLSWIAVIGMCHSLYSTYGVINDIMASVLGSGYERVNLLSLQSFFVSDIMILNLWKSMGWGSILYLSAISGIDPSLYEAAEMDGASRFQQCIHITIPSLMPTFVLLLIMACGSIFRDNFELIYGLQNPYIDFETISTVVYKEGIGAGNYSIATALGLFQGLVGFFLVSLTNKISRKVNDVALW